MPYSFEPGGGYGGLGGNYRRRYTREGRGWNTNWMRYNFTREGRGAGMGSTRRLATSWMLRRYKKKLEAGVDRVPGGRKARVVTQATNRKVNRTLDKELNQSIPGYSQMSAKKRALIRNGIKGYVLEMLTSPLLEKAGFEWWPDLPVGPSVPRRTRGKYFRRRRFR